MSRESKDAITALRVNAAFYAAIADGDLRAMDDIWSRDEPVLCIHPGGPPLQGRIAVMGSWAEIFRGGAPPISYRNDAVSMIRGLGPDRTFMLTPLLGGLDPELAWESLRLFESEVWIGADQVSGLGVESTRTLAQAVTDGTDNDQAQIHLSGSSPADGSYGFDFELAPFSASARTH